MSWVKLDNVITEREVIGEDTLPTYITTTKFNLDKVGIRVEIRNNKSDEYEPFDNIKKALLKIIKEWQEAWNKIKENIGRYELVDLIIKFYTQALAEADGWAYKVEYYEATDQVGKYIQKNKKKIDTLERLKEEKQDIDKEIQNLKKDIDTKKVEKESKKKEVVKNVEEVVENSVKNVEEKKVSSKKVISSTAVYDSPATDWKSWFNFSIPKNAKITRK